MQQEHNFLHSVDNPDLDRIPTRRELDAWRLMAFYESSRWPFSLTDADEADGTASPLVVNTAGNELKISCSAR